MNKSESKLSNCVHLPSRVDRDAAVLHHPAVVVALLCKQLLLGAALHHGAVGDEDDVRERLGGEWRVEGGRWRIRMESRW